MLRIVMKEKEREREIFADQPHLARELSFSPSLCVSLSLASAHQMALGCSWQNGDAIILDLRSFFFVVVENYFAR